MKAKTLLLKQARRVTWIVLCVAGLAPLLVTLAYVHERGRNVPFWDEWDRSANLAVLDANGALTLDDVLRTHNEHRLLLSALITLASVRLVGWSLVGEMYVGVGLAFVAWLLLVSLVRRHRHGRWTPLLTCAALSMLVFWPAQWFNWLVGFQTQVYGFMAFSIAAIRVIAGRARGCGTLIAAGALANGAQLSQAGGIAIWPAVLAGMWMLGYRRRQLVLWGAIATISLAVFLRGYALGDPPKVGIAAAGSFALAYLGGPFVSAFDDRLVGVAIAVAAIGLALFVWNLIVVVRRERGWDQAAPWTMLLFLGLGTAALVARNRGQYGLPYALVSRYATPASLAWLGLCGLSGQVIGERGRRPSDGLAPVVASVLALLLVAGLYEPTRRVALSHGLVTDEHVACLERLPETGEFACLAGTHPAFDADARDLAQRDHVLRLAAGLSRAHLLVFAPGRAALSASLAR